MKFVNIKLLIPFVLLVVGCTSPVYERVVIKSVLISEDKDWAHTVVEFPNGQRRKRNGLWGEVGDEFFADRSTTTDQWNP